MSQTLTIDGGECDLLNPSSYNWRTAMSEFCTMCGSYSHTLSRCPWRAISLTDRERHLLSLIAQGEPLKSARSELGVTQRNAETIMRRMRLRFGARTTDHLLYMFGRSSAYWEGIDLLAPA